MGAAEIINKEIKEALKIIGLKEEKAEDYEVFYKTEIINSVDIVILKIVNLRVMKWLEMNIQKLKFDDLEHYKATIERIKSGIIQLIYETETGTVPLK